MSLLSASCLAARTLHLQRGVAALALRVQTDLSSIVLGDGGDGEGVAGAPVLNLVLWPGSDGYVVAEPFDVYVGWGDGAFKDGVFSLHRYDVV